MARPPQALRRRRRIGQHATREAAIRGRDAGREVRVARIDGDGVGGAVRIGVGLGRDHGRELEGVAAAGGERSAHVSRRVSDHEGGFGGGQGGGGHDEVAFVFAREGVEDDDEVAVGCGVRIGISIFWRSDGRREEEGGEDLPMAVIVSSMVSNFRFWTMSWIPLTPSPATSL